MRWPRARALVKCPTCSPLLSYRTGFLGEGPGWTARCGQHSSGTSKVTAHVTAAIDARLSSTIHLGRPVAWCATDHEVHSPWGLSNTLLQAPSSPPASSRRHSKQKLALPPCLGETRVRRLAGEAAQRRDLVAAMMPRCAFFASPRPSSRLHTRARPALMQGSHAFSPSLSRHQPPRLSSHHFCTTLLFILLREALLPFAIDSLLLPLLGLCPAFFAVGPAI